MNSAERTRSNGNRIDLLDADIAALLRQFQEIAGRLTALEERVACSVSASPVSSSAPAAAPAIATPKPMKSAGSFSVSPAARGAVLGNTSPTNRRLVTSTASK
jgi:hypothetical protein